MSDQSGMSAMTERGALDMAIATLQSRIKDRDAEIKRLRTIIRDAHEEMISEKGEYHIKSGLGQTMAAVIDEQKGLEAK